MVPLRSATTRFGTPAERSASAPMMERVRPAQFTTTVVSGRGASAPMRYTNSPPGTSTAPGMDTRRNSSIGRLSSTTMSAPERIMASSSAGSTDGVPYSCSTHSPKALDGTLTPEKRTKPALSQAGVPPASTDTSEQPMLSRCAASRSARPPSPPSTQQTRAESRGSSVRARNSARDNGQGTAQNRWERPNSPSSRASRMASSRPSPIHPLRVGASIGRTGRVQALAEGAALGCMKLRLYWITCPLSMS